MRRTPIAACSMLALLALLAGCGSGSAPTSTTSVATSGGPVSAGTGAAATTTSPAATVPSSSPLLSGTVQIAYRQIAIHPETLRVKVGTTVKWTNYDSVEHNVTSESGPQQFASGDFGEGGTFTVKLNKSGLIHYQCTIHPASMNGTIEVVR